VIAIGNIQLLAKLLSSFLLEILLVTKLFDAVSYALWTKNRRRDGKRLHLSEVKLGPRT